MWDIFLFTGLLLISSSLLGLLPFMAVLWFISRSKDETFSHLLGSQKFTVYLVWMVVGAFMTHLFGGDIFPTYFKTVSYTHLRAHETLSDLVCRLLLEKNFEMKTKENFSWKTHHNLLLTVTSSFSAFMIADILARSIGLGY